MVHVLYEDDHYVYQMLSRDTLDGGLTVMREAFFIDENVSIAVELHKYPNARKELEELCIRTAGDGVSVVAIEKKSGRVVGAAFNKIQVKEDTGDDAYYQKFAKSCKEPSSKALVMFMMEADACCDLFSYADADCILEIMFLATLKEYRGEGIAKKLCKTSIDVVEMLLNGKNIKQSLKEHQKHPEPIPKAVSALFTSWISQKIGRSLGFTEALEINYERWSFDGKTFADRIGPKTPCVTVACKCLKD